MNSVVLFKIFNSPTFTIVPDATLLATPPPEKYVTVSVVFAGAIPKLSVFNKSVLLSETLANCVPYSLFATCCESRYTISSDAFPRPEPNITCVLLSGVSRVTNLRGTVLYFIAYVGATDSLTLET